MININFRLEKIYFDYIGLDITHATGLSVILKIMINNFLIYLNE